MNKITLYILYQSILYSICEYVLQDAGQDQAWLDLFFRYISSQPRGGVALEGPAAAEVCPRSGDEAEPQEVRAQPLEHLPGAKSMAIKAI